MFDLRHQLNDLGRLLRLTAAARGLLRWLLFGGLLGGGLAVAARLGAPAWVLPLTLAGGGVGLLACLLRPLTQNLRRRQVALLIERHDPSLRELVLSATELSEARPAAEHYSSQLTAAVIAQAAQAVAAVPRAQLLQTRRLRPLALLAAISVAFGLTLTVLYRDSLAAMLQVAEELPAVARLVAKVAPPPPEPVLSGVRLQLTPPPYTGLPARTLEVGLAVVKAPAGSRVTLSAAVPAAGQLSLQIGKSACKLSRDSGRAAYAFTLATGTTWRLAATDGVHTAIRQGRLQPMLDQRPTVRVTFPRRDLTLQALRPVKLAALASDDYGLTELALDYLPPGSKQWQRVQLGASGKVQRVEYEWDLAPLNLQGGQGVSYRFMARDNNLFIGPQVAFSQTYRITLADVRPKEAEKRLEAAREQQGEALQKLRDQAEQVQQQLQALEQQLQQGQQAELTPQQRAELQQAAAQLQKQADNLRQALAQTEQEVRQSGESSPELSRKMEEINRLLNETLDKQLKQAIQQLQQAAQGNKPDDLPQTLEQAQQAQQELLQRLDQMLALLQQAKQEGALAALRQEVEKLAARQQDLIGQREKQGDFERQSRDQKDLARDTDRVSDKLDRLTEQLAAQSDAQDLADKLQKIAESLRQSDPAGQMQQAAQSLRAGQPQQAADPQQQALQALQQAAADLAGAQADVYSKQRQELQQATAQLVASGLYLSGQQEALRDQTEPYEGNMPEQMMQAKGTLQQLTRRQQALTAGSARVAGKLAELAEKSPLVDPGLAQQAAGVAQLSTQAERELGGGAMDTALQSQEAVTIGLNQLVQKLLESDQQFQQASAQAALQEYMKRLQQMAGQQRGLNQRTQQRGGGTPQPMPGGMQPGQMPGGGRPGSLAAQQSALRQALQKMLGQAGNRGGLGDQLGGVPGQMDDVEKDLRGENVTRETYRKQADILHKMLDAQRSLYQKDREERQRKAEAPKPYKPASSPPALRQTQSQKPAPTALNAPRPDLPLGYEDLTRKYFEALGRGGR